MSLQIKLTLSFIAVSLTVISVLGTVAYTSAREYTHLISFTQAHENNRHLITSLKDHELTLDDIIAAVSHHEILGYSHLIADISQKQIIYTSPRSLSQSLLNQLNRGITKGSDDWQGYLTVDDIEYTWVADSVPTTQYVIIEARQHTRHNPYTFLEYVSIPLGMTMFIALLFAYWASTLLNNLFQRIEQQKNLLSHHAVYDTLTQLPNRSAITDIINSALAEAKSLDKKIIICLLDIDALKDINDTLGYESGDTLLRQTTDRLQNIIREPDQIGRFGGNKFVIIFTRTDNVTVDSIIYKLLNVFEPIFEIDGHNLYVGASLGISIYPDHADDAQNLIQKAETALHTANKMSINYAIYDSRFDKSSTERLTLTHDLRNAIHNDELKLYYQPKLEVKSGKITCVEALARWIHPEHGFIPPDTFIDIAEVTGLIKPLTDWVLRTAIEQSKILENMGYDIAISVNLSARNLHDETLGEQILNLITFWNIQPNKICLEITETAMMADPERAKNLLNKLDNLGLRISIDDFGTGYSSLGYLKQLPVDELKIDKSFILNMSADEDDAAIVRATIRLAHDMGLDVVAEGVEDQQAQDILQDLGCEYIQGYHIARPMPVEELYTLLEKQSNEASSIQTQAAPQPH